MKQKPIAEGPPDHDQAWPAVLLIELLQDPVLVVQVLTDNVTAEPQISPALPTDDLDSRYIRKRYLQVLKARKLAREGRPA